MKTELATLTVNSEKTTQPIKLKMADKITTFLADMALVDTAVATEFGESVQPLTKTTPKLKRIEIKTRGFPNKVKKSEMDTKEVSVNVVTMLGSFLIFTSFLQPIYNNILSISLVH